MGCVFVKGKGMPYKASTASAVNVPEDSFSSLHMFISWTMKKLTQLVDSVGYVRSCECAIL